MVNLTVLPEHIQLLNALSPHLGKKGQASAEKILSMLPVLTGQSSQGGIDSILNLFSGAGTKLNTDVLQVVGKLIKNLNIKPQKGHWSNLGTLLIVLLFFFLLLQE